MHHEHHQWRPERQRECARGRRKSARAWEDLTLSERIALKQGMRDAEKTEEYISLLYRYGD